MGNDHQHDYMLLSRMQMDNDYYLRSPHINHLYMLGVDAQIAEMKKLWNKVPEKPEWLTMEQIEEYETAMKNAIVERRRMIRSIAHGIAEELGIHVGAIDTTWARLILDPTDGTTELCELDLNSGTDNQLCLWVVLSNGVKARVKHGSDTKTTFKAAIEDPNCIEGTIEFLRQFTGHRHQQPHSNN